MFSSLVRLWRRKKLIILTVIALALIMVGFILFRSNGQIETVSPITGDLVRMVKIAGKVVPEESVELGFEIAGTVANITKDVGDTVRRGEVLARLDAGTISTDILKAAADLSLAQANLDKLEGAGVYETQIENAKRALIQTMFNAYAASDDAVHNKTDQVFIDPRSSRPELVYAFNSYFDLRDSIIKNRISIDEKLNTWKVLNQNLGVSTYTESSLSQTKKYLSEISLYISDVAQAVNLFEADSSLSQTTIDGYKVDALSARDSVNSASQNLISAEEKLKGLLLDVPVQVAKVESARATLLNYRSQLSKTAITSPIDGVVSKQDAKIGQVVSAALNLVSVISREIEIEAYVPEVLIAGISISNPALVTLDAYGEQEQFEATLIHIDPAETLRDGVSTYKVRLIFTALDKRVRSGMTANINIETYKKPGTILIPERAVLRKDGKTFIYTISDDNKRNRVLVEVGERDSTGHIELLSAFSPDIKIIIDPDND